MKMAGLSTDLVHVLIAPNAVGELRRPRLTAIVLSMIEITS
jgi:hypothetical protein